MDHDQYGWFLRIIYTQLLTALGSGVSGMESCRDDEFTAPVLTIFLTLPQLYWLCVPCTIGRVGGTGVGRLTVPSLP